MTNLQDSEKSARRLCADCVGESYLSDQVARHGKRNKCAYCGGTGRTFSIGEMADRIEQAFEQHFTRTPDQPDTWQEMMLRDKESDYDWDREGEPVIYAIMNTADIPETAATDIQRILEERHGPTDHTDHFEETEFSSESHYERKPADGLRWHREWDTFEQSLKTQARFFSRTAVELLKSVFDGIGGIKTRDDRPLIVDAGPTRSWDALYRARVFQSGKSLGEALIKPDRHLGSPPSRLANAGRMNAQGISVFYGSQTPEVALAEVRPPVGARVVVARFEIIRPITLLDLTAFDGVIREGSVFDPHYADALERLAFLRSITRRIVRPVQPDDEAFDYLATQAVADYLATEADTPVDGIIFPSVQADGGGLNVVLFYKAAGVERIVLPEGTKTSFREGYFTDEGWETEYTVHEEIPLLPAKNTVREDDGGWPEETLESDNEGYLPTLRVDPSCIYVHSIKTITFKTERHQVSRVQWQQPDPDHRPF